MRDGVGAHAERAAPEERAGRPPGVEEKDSGLSGLDYKGLIGNVARDLMGEPNAKLSSARELRFGTHGSLSVDLEKDTWFDHELQEGGGVLDLIVREEGHGARKDAHGWLVQRGYVSPEPPRSASPAAFYDYTDEHGELLFQVERRAGHKFLQRRPAANGGWEYKVRGVRQVPYRLPELLADPDALVFIPEGEKDVDNLRALGLVATCNAGGARKWRATHAAFLQGRDVVILPDNDDEGRAHAEQVRESLEGIAASVRVLELPNLPAKGDVSDWLAAGGTRESLLAMLPEPEVAESPLRPVPLDGVMEEEAEEWPHVIQAYFPRRVTTLVGGHGGVGKSMLALIFAAHVAAGRPWGPLAVEHGRAVFLSFEDEAKILRQRLRRIIEVYQLPPAEVFASLTIFDGSDAETELAIESADGTTLDFTPMMGLVADAIDGADFVIVDNASDTYGANENQRRQVRRFIRRLSQEARGNDAAVVLLAHIDKSAAKYGGKGNNFSGSTQWHNSVRSRLALVESDEAGIQLLHEKANYGPTYEPLTLMRGTGGVLEQVAPEAAAAARQMTKAMTVKSDAEAVLRVFEALISSNVTIPTAETGQRTTYHVLARAPELPDEYRTAAGKERVKAAIQTLERDCRIAREEYRKPDRKMGERWALPHFPVEEAA